ncbi:MAG: hypothetical protein ACRDBG_18465, partial [Waterburya sp.]
NIIVFDSEANFAQIDLNLAIPDVNNVIGAVQLPNQNLKTTTLNPCPVNANAASNQPQPIETSQGKIYPARGLEIKNGVVRLTAQPTAGSPNRTSGQFNSCD